MGYSRPFLKWAGSKYRVLNTILATLPKGKRLIEPFVGSGAVFLNATFEHNLLADTNQDLINLFLLIQKNGEEFIDFAASYFIDKNNKEDIFYAYRNEFNSTESLETKSALFIYLNRHCFNGLYRCNSKGLFNVPFGRYKQPKFPYEELINFYKSSKNASFKHQDFLITMDLATEGDVVYCDPPYVPLSPTASFSDYTAAGFSQVQQEALALKALELKQKGIKVIISNHDTPFTREIYKAAQITSFDVQRFIAAKASKRVKAPELVASF